VLQGIENMGDFAWLGGRESAEMPSRVLRRQAGLIHRETVGPYNRVTFGPDPGSRLGPYEVSTSIAVGGMGEVFRARDTKLHREVASGENAETTHSSRWKWLKAA
jgi:hypothetical protein